ncbi:hypothetical protein [uncultured Psychrobacter sp.]|uniref:hypothetical protein n=1 Tax=uncultured Psychrobacter sp. TaxID=259303 RepID=UPI00259330B9|nr:hypothetical protein [uncultured Psychrobacter sp.]
MNLVPFNSATKNSAAIKSVSKISCLGLTTLLLALTGCATQQGIDASNQNNVSSMSNSGSNGKSQKNLPAAQPKKETYFFSSSEIKDLSAAFKAGSCDLGKLSQQSQKYGLSDTWVNLYDRTPKPLAELNKQEKCFLAQSNELYAYGDEFEDESQQSLNDTWYKGNIPSDAKVATMRFMTPKALIPNCDSKLGRPIFVDYEKDDQGKIVRTILVNEDFDLSCVN